MELLYLVVSILSTTFTSTILSLLLPFRFLLRRVPNARAAPVTENSVVLYQGTVWHERRRPVNHAFRYPVRYALFDLDGSYHAPPNHLSADEARRIATTNGPVYLLTIPPSVGYEQNPLSLYYCYDLESSKKILRKCIAEVTNSPWGEKVSFLFDPSSDVVAKSLHVSPFMDMLGKWSMKTSEPGDSLHVVISVQHPKLGNYFTASLKAKRVTTSVDHAAFFWLMPHKVALWIYWHALKLWWKNVPFVQHPRYQNPAYREEALLHDQTIQCSRAFEGNESSECRELGQTFDRVSITENIRCCTWTDASWPWC